MIRAVLIGVRGYGELYLSQLLRLVKEGKVQFLGAVIRNSENARLQIEQINEVGAKVFETTEAMYTGLHDSIDLCCIPTEPHSHAKLTIEALEHGCHVLVEKPAAVTIQDIEAMRKLAQKAGKEVMVGFQNIYDEDIQSLKRRLLNGELGTIQTIKMRGMWSRGSQYYSRNDWAGKMKIGDDWILDSPANNAFAHFINLQCFLGGSSFEVSTSLSSIRAELYQAMSIECCDTVFIKALTSSGISLQSYVTHACAESLDPQIKIIGSEGALTWSMSNIAQSRINMFDKIIEHLQGSDELVCDLNIASATTECVNAMHVASLIYPVSACSSIETETGEQIAINDIGSVIQEAFEKELLPSEFHVPWARKSKVMDCRGLNSFPK